jgi:hypothetical protein
MKLAKSEKFFGFFKFHLSFACYNSFISRGSFTTKPPQTHGIVGVAAYGDPNITVNLYKEAKLCLKLIGTWAKKHITPKSRGGGGKLCKEFTGFYN